MAPGAVLNLVGIGERDAALKLLEHPDPAVRRAVAKGWLRAEPAKAPALLFAHPSADARQAAAEVLPDVDFTRISNDTTWASALRGAAVDPDPVVRVRAIQAIVRRKEAAGVIPALADCLSSPDRDVRRAGAAGLAAAGPGPPPRNAASGGLRPRAACGVADHSNPFLHPRPVRHPFFS